ncbi:MAG: CPBP family intramembrane glutamic endopeptidase [Haloechinothrix sp.]
MPSSLRTWLSPTTPPAPKPIADPRERKAVVFELALVFSITLGLSALRSLLSFLDSLLRPEPLAEQQVALNTPQAAVDTIDLLKQLLGVLQLVGWGALGLYLLWRAGIGLSRIGLGRRLRVSDVGIGCGLAALIGSPGLALYFIGWRLGLNLAVLPSTVDETWWRPITLTLAAFGNSFAEEVLVVGYLLTRLRQLGVGENASLLLSAILRGAYHFYQGVGGFVGNLIMGLIFGRVWQRTTRLWPLIIAHTLLDVVTFVGYSLLRGHVGWLP